MICCVTSGETIALPEGDKPAGEAIQKFARLDKQTGLLGRGILRFDMRIPGKMVARLPRAPGEAIEPAAQLPAEPVPAPTAPKPAAPETGEER